MASFAFNLYLRMLGFSFQSLFKTQNQSNTLIGIFSGLRAAITGSIIAILILKFKLNLIALGLAFIFYQLIFIGVGLYTNAHNRTNSRTNS